MIERKPASQICLNYPLIAIAASALVLLAGCGMSASGESTQESTRILTASEAKQLLTRLPYQYEWRKVKRPDGASGALAGTAVGKFHTVLHFGVSLGKEAAAVPVPQARAFTPYYYGRGGFVFNDDLVLPKGIGKQFHTAAQWHEGGRMEVEMTERLCQAVTHEPCPA